MASALKPLTLEEFRAQYADAKPYFEYWFGEAVQKSVPTTLHGVLQQVLCMLFTLAGCRTGSEIELRVAGDWQPKPDVIASKSALESPYPTRPVELVAEILSPDDSVSRLLEKCRNYKRIGIRTIVVFDPTSRAAWEWSGENGQLERIDAVMLPNGAAVAVDQVWRELDKQMS